mmetsp:Transcript_53023/g.141746  ORF Transcript_53023/g.141746 Transcript_53023/m.141746 type:complete len:254 (-) Transcript_53023:337-1098(-)
MAQQARRRFQQFAFQLSPSLGHAGANMTRSLCGSASLTTSNWPSSGNVTARSSGVTGHYAQLAGLYGEQARRACRGEVAERSNDGWSIATFAGGCFWGPQLLFDRIHGVVFSSVGYGQGRLPKPTYYDVCGGKTGHTEVVQVFYDETEVKYEELLEAFWNDVDPTVVNGQGYDYGPQYRTGIYCHSAAQLKAAVASREAEQVKQRLPVATEVMEAKVFWPAELDHQCFLALGGRFGNPQSSEKGCVDRIRCYG